MSLLHFDGFEVGHLPRDAGWDSGFFYGRPAGQVGTGVGAQGYAHKTFPNASHLFWGGALWHNDGQSNYMIFYDGGVQQLRIDSWSNVSGTGVPKGWRIYNSANVLLFEIPVGSGGYTHGEWNRITGEAIFGGAGVGRLILRREGVAFFDELFDTATGTANDYCNEIRLGAATGNIRHDDFWLCDDQGPAPHNGDLGHKVRVFGGRPSANGAHTAWTPNTGQAWQCVDDSPGGANDDTDRIDTNTVGAKASFVVPDPLPAGVGAVLGVIGAVRWRKTDVAAREGRFLFRNASAVEHALASIALPDTYDGSTTSAYPVGPIALSPFTGIAWSQAEVNGLEPGIEATV